MRRCAPYILTLYKSGQLPGRRRHGAGAACVNCLGEIGRNATARFRLNGEGETARGRSNFRDRKCSCTSHIGLDKQGYVNRSLSRQKGGGGLSVNCPCEIGRNATVRLRSKGEGETGRERSNFRDRKRSRTSHIGLDKQGYVNRALSRQNPPPHDAWQLRWWVVQPVEA